ncbi:hypothetical protein GCM10011490_07090 [Pseudoclavibacter endophyticus]|uniref:Uncharacterized protein n=1 Tax=Pseudoclavibacter endophyticus TaxID=1778590 RepID=A0A6H9WSA3_9MICO|nr:hypothetical protein [Pseudoclavibacter endophyticus]KAB1649807.1 hypothetical protein F8O04_06135 [Pseudoclavibacter endophyticus]GGA59601.1 hypothetical protein GCM10011490_07090 [Pseudoclavibacter endophyticus]
MPTFAVLLQYEVVSGLIIEADDEDQAAQLASEFEATAHEAISDSDAVRVSSRLWGDGTIEVEPADTEEDAEDLLDEWIDELDDESSDADDEDDEVDVDLVDDTADDTAVDDTVDQDDENEGK